MIGLYKRTCVKAEDKLDRDYQAVRSAALRAQRDGDIRQYQRLNREAEILAAHLESFRQPSH